MIPAGMYFVNYFMALSKQYSLLECKPFNLNYVRRFNNGDKIIVVLECKYLIRVKDYIFTDVLPMFNYIRK